MGVVSPRVRLEAAKQIFHTLHAAIAQRLVRACHDLSEGGLATALAEMSFAGELGLIVDLEAAASRDNLTATELLFTESNSRFVIEVEPAFQAVVEKLFGGLPLVQLGRVSLAPDVQISRGTAKIIDKHWSELFQAWHSPLDWA